MDAGHMRAHIEAGLALLTGLLCLAAIFVPDWIEKVAGFDPDGGDGTLERVVALGFGLATVVLGFSARRHYRGRVAVVGEQK